MYSAITDGLRRLKSPYVEVNSAVSFKPDIYDEYNIFKRDGNLIISVMAYKKSEKEYNPFNNSQLFSQFARIHSDEGIIKFVSQNGFLIDEHNQMPKGRTSFNPNLTYLPFENYNFFMDEVHKARQLYDLLTLIIRKDEKKIKDRLKLKLKRPFPYDIPDEAQHLACDMQGECYYQIYFDGIEYTPLAGMKHIWDKYTPSKILDYAFFFLIEKISEKLSGKIHLDFNTIIKNEDDNFLKFKPIPAYSFDDLLTVMYFCFYSLLSRGIETNECQWCGNTFIPLGRRSAKYCPDCLEKYGGNIYMMHKRREGE